MLFECLRMRNNTKTQPAHRASSLKLAGSLDNVARGSLRAPEAERNTRSLFSGDR
jgi:hypothetical protein